MRLDRSVNSGGISCVCCSSTVCHIADLAATLGFTMLYAKYNIHYVAFHLFSGQECVLPCFKTTLVSKAFEINLSATSLHLHRFQSFGSMCSNLEHCLIEYVYMDLKILVLMVIPILK